MKDERYFHEGDVQYLEKLRELHNGSPFFSEGRRLEKLKRL